MTNINADAAYNVLQFLNHLGDDELFPWLEPSITSFLNHLGDDEQATHSIFEALRFLNHLGDDEPSLGG